MNDMHPLRWIPAGVSSLLDAGCNTGELLGDCRKSFPSARLVGVDLNASAIEAARRKLPDVEFHQGSSHHLAFADGEFDCITCIEVIEHVPRRYRKEMLGEFWRALRPGGRLILRCPHAGWFGWLDAQNVRFQFPRVYAAVAGGGMRDGGYEAQKEEVVWHHHFTYPELMTLLGPGWTVEARRNGGFLLFPLMDFLSHPFYRLQRPHHPLRSVIHAVADWDMGIDLGNAAYDILLVLRKGTQTTQGRI